MSVATATAAAPPSLRRNVLLTTGANIAFAAAQWFALVLLARLGSPANVGRYALALGLTTPIFQLANVQLRELLATEPADGISPRTYATLRAWAIGAALAGSLVAVPVAGDGWAALAVVGAVALSKGVDSALDLLYGALQRREALPRVARSMFARAVGATVVGGGALALGADATGFALALAVAWGAVLAWDWLDARRLGLFAGRPATREAVGRLLALAWPMGVVMAILALYVSLPRFALERSHGAAAVGVLAALGAMQVPVTTLASAVAASTNPRLARFLAERDRAAARALLVRLLGGSVVLGAIGVVLAPLVGPWIAQFAYGEAFRATPGAFVALGVSTAATLIGTFTGAMATVMRIVRPQLAIHTVGVLGVLAASAWLVPAHGIEGALAALAIGQVLAGIGFAGLVVRGWRGWVW